MKASLVLCTLILINLSSVAHASDIKAIDRNMLYKDPGSNLQPFKDVLPGTLMAIRSWQKDVLKPLVDTNPVAKELDARLSEIQKRDCAQFPEIDNDCRISINEAISRIWRFNWELKEIPGPGRNLPAAPKVAAAGKATVSSLNTKASGWKRAQPTKQKE